MSQARRVPPQPSLANCRQQQSIIFTNNTITSTTVGTTVSPLQLRLHAMGDDYKPRARDDDEVSLISMRELAPSPIDDEYEYEYEKTTPPPPLQQSKSSALHRHSPHTDGLTLWRNLPPPPASCFPLLVPCTRLMPERVGSHASPALQLLRLSSVLRRARRHGGRDAAGAGRRRG